MSWKIIKLNDLTIQLTITKDLANDLVDVICGMYNPDNYPNDVDVFSSELENFLETEME